MFYGTKIDIFCDFGKQSSKFYDKYFCECKFIANFGDKLSQKGSLKDVYKAL